MRAAFGNVSRWIAVRFVGSRGASLVEYTLLISLIALAALAGLTAFGGGVNASIDDSAGKIVSAGGATLP